jgi:hypothetical protein
MSMKNIYWIGWKFTWNTQFLFKRFFFVANVIHQCKHDKCSWPFINNFVFHYFASYVTKLSTMAKWNINLLCVWEIADLKLIKLRQEFTKGEGLNFFYSQKKWENILFQNDLLNNPESFKNGNNMQTYSLYT